MESQGLRGGSRPSARKGRYERALRSAACSPLRASPLLVFSREREQIFALLSSFAMGPPFTAPHLERSAFLEHYVHASQQLVRGGHERDFVALPLTELPLQIVAEIGVLPLGRMGRQVKRTPQVRRPAFGDVLTGALEVTRLEDAWVDARIRHQGCESREPIDVADFCQDRRRQDGTHARNRGQVLLDPSEYSAATASTSATCVSRCAIWASN